MADQYDHPPKPTRVAPPPFAGPPRGGSLTPKTRVDRPTLPPFSPPFVKRPSPAVSEGQPRSTAAVPPTSTPPMPADPAWLDERPNEATAAEPIAEVGVAWVNPDEPAVAAPPQEPTGIEWLDSPAPGAAPPPASTGDVDDVFGWDPAEDRPGALDTAPVSESLEALKELEPWAMPGASSSASGADEVADALERIAARVRSGDLFVPGSMPAASDEAVLAAVLAALLQRSRG
jgi:hypothetical protein